VLRTVTRESAILTATGLCLGLIVSGAIAHSLSGLLYGAGKFDWVVFSGVAGLVILVTALAAWLPARRALRIDPLIALRSE
jgi:ABC-type antimicrobial peptide transport system permease subunit